MKRMSKSKLTMLCAAVVAASVALSCAPSKAASSEEVFNKAMKDLDKGGEMLMYVNIDGLPQKALDGLRSFVSIAAEAEPDAKEALVYIDKTDAYLKEIGLYNLQSWGMSSRQRADGLCDIKTGIGLSGGGQIWSVMGDKPRALKLAAYAPADAALVEDFTFNPALLWQIIRKGVAQIGGEKIDGQLQGMLDGLKEEKKIDAEKLVQSLGDEMMLSVTMPTAHAAPGEMPALPSGFVAFSVTDDAALQMMLGLVSNPQTPMKTEEVDGAKIYSMPGVKPAQPSPTFAYKTGLLMIGSSVECVKGALTAASTGKNLVSGEEIAKLMPDGIGPCNVMVFFSERYMKGIMAMNPQAGAGPQAALQQKMMGLFNMFPMLSVGSCGPDGMKSTTIAKMDGRIMLAYSAVVPVAVMAAVAIPSFTQARTKSQGAMCKNNLRMLAGAKDQYMLDNNNKEPASIADLVGPQAYIKTMPRCPQGGVYTLGGKNEEPSCSVHGSL